MDTFDTEVLKLAFTWHLVSDLARADGTVTSEEQALAGRICPQADLLSTGLAHPDGSPTERGLAARKVALERLPGELPQPDKLALLTRLFELCVVDGWMDREEGSLLFLAGSLLGVGPTELDAHLDTLTEHVGEVDLQEVEAEA